MVSEHLVHSCRLYAFGHIMARVCGWNKCFHSRENAEDARNSPMTTCPQGHTERSRHEVLPLTKKLSAIDNNWQRKNQFSPVEYHWVYIPHSRASPIYGNSWLIQNELIGIFVDS